MADVPAARAGEKRPREDAAAAPASRRAAFRLTAVSEGVRGGIQQMVLDHVFAGADFNRHKYVGDRPQLPGPLAAALTRRHLSVVAREEYWVCEKSDGERFMLLLLPAAQRGVPPNAYMIDRTFQAFTFEGGDVYVSKLSPDAPSLLDGELIRRADDAGTGTGATALFMMFDAITYRGVRVGLRPFQERMAAIGNVRVSFRDADAALSLPLYMLGKHFERETGIARIFTCISELPRHAPGPSASASLTAPLESEEDSSDGAYMDVPPQRMYRNDRRVNLTDGIVFTPNATPYRDLISHGGEQLPLLKWKFADENTVDFRVRSADLEGFGQGALRSSVPLFVETHGGGDGIAVTRLALTEPVADAYMRLCSRLRKRELMLECWYDASASTWKVKRVRDRKTSANHVTTAWSTLEVMSENITREELERHLARRAAPHASHAAAV